MTRCFGGRPRRPGAGCPTNASVTASTPAVSTVVASLPPAMGGPAGVPAAFGLRPRRAEAGEGAGLGVRAMCGLSGEAANYAKEAAVGTPFHHCLLWGPLWPTQGQPLSWTPCCTCNHSRARTGWSPHWLEPRGHHATTSVGEQQTATVIQQRLLNLAAEMVLELPYSHTTSIPRMRR